MTSSRTFWEPRGYLILSSAQGSFAWTNVDVSRGGGHLLSSCYSFTKSAEFVSLYNWGSFIGFHTEVVLFLTAYSVLLLELLKKLSVGKESCGGRDFIVRKTE